MILVGHSCKGEVEDGYSESHRTVEPEAGFRQLAVNAMRAGHSRAWPGQEYLSICECIRHREASPWTP